MIRIGMPVFVWQGQHTTAEALWIRLAALVVLVLLGVLAASRKGRKRTARKEVFPARCQRNAPVAFSRAILCRPLGFGYFVDMFKNRVGNYVRQLISKTKPKKVIVWSVILMRD